MLHINYDDAVVFETKNQSSLEHSEVCDETDLQDRNNMSEALILDNRNTSTLGQSPVEAPEFCNELVIEEEMTRNEAHQLSYISDSVLNDVNNQSHQIVEVNDFALTTIKMPVSIKKRGRPKGQDLPVIGLPKKKKRCTVAFAKQSYHEKQNVILDCFVKDRNIVRDITNGKFLETVDLWSVEVRRNNCSKILKFKTCAEHFRTDDSRHNI
ncbi:uncharacterized protein LOC115884198 isoform X1 [Sitophilus oryzae]|uniref:Uncharacterized protein LOC115884198 isoform X1 n=1 Tax=Sitophilus oryzae TaxID=7048 RepID=A0A6J2Y671_SITOR|nr:uncharacterized protein LOC115884198 isoform X1 [Sitophilus oryzae]